MMRRFLGGHSPFGSSTKANRPMPTLSDDDGSILEGGYPAAVIGKSHSVLQPQVSPASTESPDASLLGTSSGTSSENEASGEDLRSRFRAPFAQLSAKYGRGGEVNTGAGLDFGSDAQDDTGAGLGFGSGAQATAVSSACCAAGEDTVTLDVIRSAMFSSSGQEDVLKVAILRTANVAGVRKSIAQLYGLPVAEQRLQRTPELGGAPLLDAMPVAKLVHSPIFLLPADVDVDDIDDEDFERPAHAQARQQQHEDQMGRAQTDAQEREALMRGVAESLQGVTYNVHIVVPEAASSHSGPKTLVLDAMARVGDVQAILEAEMMSSAGKRPMLLIFNGQALPPNIPLHFAGVRDGDTLAAVIERHRGGYPEDEYDDDDESDDDPIAAWA